MVLNWIGISNPYSNKISNIGHQPQLINEDAKILMNGFKPFGATENASMINESDISVRIPLTGINKMDFFFFGKNYGNGSGNIGTPTYDTIFWSSNNILSFGTPVVSMGSNPADFIVGPAIALGTAERRINKFYYYPVLAPAPNVKVLRFQIYFQNVYNDGMIMSGRMQVRLIRTPQAQYIEVAINQSPENIGKWAITDGGQYINTNMTTELENTEPSSARNLTSFILRSNLSGQNWEFLDHHYIDY